MSGCGDKEDELAHALKRVCLYPDRHGTTLLKGPVWLGVVL